MIRLGILFLVVCAAVPLCVSFLWEPPLFAWICCCVAWGFVAGQWFGQATYNHVQRRWEQGEL